MEREMVFDSWALSLDDNDMIGRLNAHAVKAKSPSPITQHQSVQSRNGSGGSINARKQSLKIILHDAATEDLGIALNRAQLGNETEAQLAPGLPASHQPLQYLHQRSSSFSGVAINSQSPSEGVVSERNEPNQEAHGLLHASNSRPGSSYLAGPDTGRVGRNLSPKWSSQPHSRNSSSPGGLSPDLRNYRHSVLDLQRLPYAQQFAPSVNFAQHGLQASIGKSASLLSHKKTLEMYRDNAKKATDPEIQYAFATFLVETAQTFLNDPNTSREYDEEDPGKTAQSFFNEARQILQQLADRGYPFAQYYLADGLANGVLNKGKEDDGGALQLFVAASKRGHAESAYRAALCYEFGWGSNKSPLKSAEYYRHAASKHHPGAMIRLSRACLAGELGIDVRYREGIKWLKRAAEAADEQYNAAPYELGLLHESGYGDDVFKDENYAVQLFTRSADLGHAESNFRLGDMYEHGALGCPDDPGLSIHFYSAAAMGGHSGAMLALCAWYMVGAPPVLEKNENEAYEWARRAGDAGLPKAQYAVGYFTEMGIGCQRDPLEANVWYVHAADQRELRAMSRLAAIQAAHSGKQKITSRKSAAAVDRLEVSIASNESKGRKRWKVF